ncbi:MAG: serine protease, partial [Tyzzerella sp.]|nr:serine protease [Tyzzerella sp.]
TKGSIITGFEGMTIDGMDSLQEQLTYYAAGTEVTVTIQTPTRDGEYVESEVVVTLKKNNS